MHPGTRVLVSRDALAVPLPGHIKPYSTPNAVGNDASPIAPIDTFTVTWDGHGHLDAAGDSKAPIHQYINDGPGWCTWPLRRRLLNPMPDSPEESEDDAGEEEYYEYEDEDEDEDEDDEAPPTDPAENEDDCGQTLVTRKDLVAQLTDDLHAIDSGSAVTGAPSIEHCLDAQPSNWIHDKDEILASSDFPICHHEEHDPYTERRRDYQTARRVQLRHRAAKVSPKEEPYLDKKHGKQWHLRCYTQIQNSSLAHTRGSAIAAR
jgi:hypothetical protein